VIPKGVVVAWRFAECESYAQWRKLLDALHGKPCAVVCDGQKGLEKAMFERWPDIFLQRCTVHVERQALAWLTRKPKTDAGRELRSLVLLTLESEISQKSGRMDSGIRIMVRSME
jgi:putative transposase